MLPGRLRDARLFPVVTGPAIGVMSVAEGLTDAAFRPHLRVLVVVGFWLMAALLAQVRFPAVGAVLVGCFYPLAAALGFSGLTGAGLIALLLASGYAGFSLPPRRSLLAVAVAAATFVGTDIVIHGPTWDTLFLPAVFFPARWAGRLVSRERTRSAQLFELTEQLNAQRDAAERAAVAEERARIAREVHDSVAHSVSVMTLQTGGLRRQLAGVLVDRPQETEVLLGLERLGRQTVEELRTLVGILRADGEPPSTVVASLARAGDVINDVRAAGLAVDFDVRGEPVPLPRALDLSAFRILQEALTNVLRHAPDSRAEVELVYSCESVDIWVRDRETPDQRTRRPTTGTPGGHGLVSLRERAQMFGGSLAATPSEDGFVVHAKLPLHRSWT